jgi:multiple sugar transport system ATP-binding protein
MTMADRIFIMSKGVLQQSGAPMEVYSRPVNRFVAGFIGSPAMNFIDATLVRGDGGLIVDAESFKVALPEAFNASLAGYVGRQIVFGVRPEDMALAGNRVSGEQNILTARAEVVELLGSEVFVYLSCGRHSIVARMEVPDRAIEVGDTLQVALKMPKTHVFDKDTSLTIA